MEKQMIKAICSQCMCLPMVADIYSWIKLFSLSCNAIAMLTYSVSHIAVIIRPLQPFVANEKSVYAAQLQSHQRGKYRRQMARLLVKPESYFPVIYMHGEEVFRRPAWPSNGYPNFTSNSSLVACLIGSRRLSPGRAHPCTRTCTSRIYLLIRHPVRRCESEWAENNSIHWQHAGQM